MYSFIGESPDPLPLPPGMTTKPQRFVGPGGVVPSKGPPLAQRIVSPTQLKIRYMKTDPEGRLKPESLLIEELPEGVTVRYMIMQVREMLALSPRHPIELRYFGEPLQLINDYNDALGELPTDRELSFYSIKDHSEITVVVKPLLTPAQARVHPQVDPNCNRLRIVSHKLAAPIPIEGIIPSEMKIRDLMFSLTEWLKKNPTISSEGPRRL